MQGAAGAVIDDAGAERRARAGELEGTGGNERAGAVGVGTGKAEGAGAVFTELVAPTHDKAVDNEVAGGGVRAAGDVHPHAVAAADVDVDRGVDDRTGGGSDDDEVVRIDIEAFQLAVGPGAVAGDQRGSIADGDILLIQGNPGGEIETAAGGEAAAIDHNAFGIAAAGAVTLKQRAVGADDIAEVDDGGSGGHDERAVIDGHGADVGRAGVAEGKCAGAVLDEVVRAVKGAQDGGITIDGESEIGGGQNAVVGTPGNGVGAGAGRTEGESGGRDAVGESDSVVGGGADPEVGDVAIGPGDIGRTIPPIRGGAAPETAAILRPGGGTGGVPDERIAGDGGGDATGGTGGGGAGEVGGDDGVTIVHAPGQAVVGIAGAGEGGDGAATAAEDVAHGVGAGGPRDVHQVAGDGGGNQIGGRADGVLHEDRGDIRIDFRAGIIEQPGADGINAGGQGGQGVGIRRRRIGGEHRAVGIELHQVDDMAVRGRQRGGDIEGGRDNHGQAIRGRGEIDDRGSDERSELRSGQALVEKLNLVKLAVEIAAAAAGVLADVRGTVKALHRVGHVIRGGEQDPVVGAHVHDSVGG